MSVNGPLTNYETLQHFDQIKKSGITGQHCNNRTYKYKYAIILFRNMKPTHC